MRRTIGVVSGKGGVGKTTLVANLSLALHGMGENVIAVDGNLGTANLSLHFGLVHFPITLHDVLEGGADVGQAIYTHNTGLRIIPSSLSLRYSKSSGKRLKDIVGSLDGMTLIDSSPGLHDQSIDTINACDEVLVIATPEASSLTDAMKVITVAREMEKKLLGVIINRSRGKKHEFTGEEVSAALGLPVIGTIPEDGLVRESAFCGMPLVLYNPFAKASMAFKTIAASLVGKTYRPPPLWQLKRLMWFG